MSKLALINQNIVGQNPVNFRTSRTEIEIKKTWHCRNERSTPEQIVVKLHQIVVLLKQTRGEKADM